MWFALFIGALAAGGVWWLFWITFKEEWESEAREEGFKEGFAQALIESGIALDDKDHKVSVRTIHPLDEVTEIDAIAVPEHNPTEEMPPDPGIVIPLQKDDEAGH